MALVATILSPRSSAAFYHLCMASVAAAKLQSHLIIPTNISSVRRMSTDDTNLKHLQSQLKSMEAEVKSLRKDKQVLLRKHKDPALKDIELVMSEVQSSQQDKRLPLYFRVKHDSSDHVILESATHIPEEVIRLEVSKPLPSGGVPLHISVGSHKTLGSKVHFYCTIREDGCRMDEIEAGFFGRREKMSFSLLPVKVKNQFYKYLESRGVSSRTTESIYEYMIQKQRGAFYQRFKKIAEEEAA